MATATATAAISAALSPSLLLAEPVKLPLAAGLLAAALLGVAIWLARRRSRLALLPLAGAVMVSVAAYGAFVPTAQLFGPTFCHGRTSERVIALTFDDGPDPRYTPALLAVLRRYDAHATFFVCGEAAERYPALVRRTAAAGHEVGSHGYRHVDLLRLGPAGLRRELAAGQAALARCGVHATLLRPPYGFRSPLVCAAARRQGLQVVGWDAAGHDWPSPSPRAIADSVLGDLAPGQVVLLHDGRGDHRHTVAALDLILAELRRRGYRSVTLTELQGLSL